VSEPVAVNATTTEQEYEFEAWVPDDLPEGETDESVANIFKAQLVRLAALDGFQINPATYASEDGEPAPRGPSDPTPGRVVVWRATGVQVKAKQEIAVKAEERADGTWCVDLDEPFDGGLYAIKHGLNTEAVIVECYREDGSPIGYVEVMPIAPDDVEVITVPDTAAIIVYAAPEEPESDDEGQNGA
jgi:hypothetical protein